MPCILPAGSPYTMQPELRVTNGSGSWTPPSPQSSGGTMSVRILIDGPNVNVYHAKVGPGAGQLSGRIDGDTMRAKGTYCTLSLTRDPSSAPTASSPYDGTYALTTRVGSASNTGFTTFTLRVARSSGLITISYAGCTTSQIDVTISPAGEVSGQGDLKCILTGNNASMLTGPLTISGRIAESKAALQIIARAANYSLVLPLSAN